MKSKKIITVLTIAVVLCIVAGAGTYMVLSPQRDTIYVFRQDCTAGTQITTELLYPVEVDATIIEMGAAADLNSRFVTAEEYTTILQDAGTLRYDVTQGTALMKSMLTTYGGSKVEMEMKPSSIAVTVPSDYLAAVTNELGGGSYVNVYASYDDGAKTLLILQNIRVLTAPRVDGVLAGVTLEVTHEQSLKLIHAMSYAKITFGLVNGQGYQYTIEDQPAYDIGGFIIGAETSASEPEPDPTPAPTQSEQPSTPPPEAAPTAVAPESATPDAAPTPEQATPAPNVEVPS